MKNVPLSTIGDMDLSLFLQPLAVAMRSSRIVVRHRAKHAC